MFVSFGEESFDDLLSHLAQTLLKRRFAFFLSVLKLFCRQVVQSTEGQGDGCTTETDDVERHAEVRRR